jgi:hypothetical protein
MNERRPMPEAPASIHRQWDNSELRHRLEGREIDGIDVLQLQLAIVARETGEPQLDPTMEAKR